MKLLIPTLLALSLVACHSTKKSIKTFEQKIKETGFFRSDSSGSKLTEQTNVSSDSLLIKKVEESGQETETQETVIDWITAEPVQVDNKTTIPAGTKVTHTQRTIKQKGQSTTTTEMRSGSSDTSNSLTLDNSAHVVLSGTGKSVDTTGKIKEVSRSGIPWYWWLLLAVAGAFLAWWKRKWIMLRIFGIKPKS